MASSPPPQTPVDLDAPQHGQPAWKIALLFPPQGSWTEADYLQLNSRHLIEFSNGCVEVLDMPTKAHQRIVRFLFQLLYRFVVAEKLGEVFFAPLPVRLWSEKFREPDLVFLRTGRGEYRGFPDGADLVVEVVSEGEANRRRDLETKAEEYSRAGIAEYWIVDPLQNTITVLTLIGGGYQQHGVFRPGQAAASVSLAGFSAPVADVFQAAEREAE